MSLKIAATAIIHPGVVFEGSAVVEDWCIIGVPANDTAPLEKTIIGDGAVIRSHTVIYAGNNIGAHFTTGNKANIREGNNIGGNVSVGTMAVVEHHVTIGNGVRLHSQVFVPEYTILEDGCWLGPNVVLTNTRYPLSPQAKTSPQPVRVQRRAIIGANATILPGVLVGADSLVGAGSLVAKNVQAGAVVAGNPAQFIRMKDELPYS
jgi:acetyltransferase-like isoleucine patch superfamily enzyme